MEIEMRKLCTALSLTLLCGAAPALAADEQAMIDEALSAPNAGIAEVATVMDWEGDVLRAGSDEWICYPTPPGQEGTCPLCLDAVWREWADAWINKKDFKATRVGHSYMLASDCGASNTDPYAEGPTADNEWHSAGPHLMVIVPDTASLEGVSTDPHAGAPYVMWKGTPYAHVMIPVE